MKHTIAYLKSRMSQLLGTGMKMGELVEAMQAGHIMRAKKLRKEIQQVQTALDEVTQEANKRNAERQIEGRTL